MLDPGRNTGVSLRDTIALETMMLDSMTPTGDPKLTAVLARLCDGAGSLWTTQAVKLPYLIDLVANHVLGKPITQSHHKAWKMGVVTARAWGLVKRANGGKHFRVEGDPYADGCRLYLAKPPAAELSERELAIVDFVLEEFGDMPADELGALTKELNPEIQVWGGKKVVQLSEAAYQRLPVWFGEDEEDAKTAALRIKELEEDPALVVAGQEAQALLAAWGSS